MSRSLLAHTEPTDTHTVQGEANARLVAARLITTSIEFHVEPLPDDYWQFTVKGAEVTYAAAAFLCWQFFGVADDAEYGLWCDLPVHHKGKHNDRRRATYHVAQGFGR